MEQVILVNSDDEQIGLMEKIEAHKKGLLHRAFSVFIFNDNDDILIHQRADNKYHSGGLWTNACCSHPREGERIEDAGSRRLQEEMGFTCAVEKQFSFIYEANLDNEMTEYEFDHVLFGRFNAQPNPNPMEVQNWKYVSINELETDLELHPENYTIWFKLVFNRVKEYLEQQ